MTNNYIETSQFKDLYPDYGTFKSKIIEPMLTFKINGGYPTGEIPPYLDETQMYYPYETLYALLFNKYSEFAAVNTDDKQNFLMSNAFLNVLPALYAKTKMLSKEAMAMLTPEKLLENIERRYNEDADNKYASTETSYSSTPNSSQATGTFVVDNVKEKNAILRKDATVRIKEMSNFITKLNELSNSEISGFVDAFINTIEISSLWEYSDGETIKLLKLEGKEGPHGPQGPIGPEGPKGDDAFASNQDEFNRAMQPELNKLKTDVIKPIEDTADAIGLNQFEAEDGTNSQFDGSNPKIVYTKGAVDAKFNQLGKFRGTYASITELRNINNPINGDYAHVGTADPYQEWVYNGTTSAWEEGGIAKPHGGATFGDGAKTTLQTGVAYSKGEADPFRTVKDLTALTTVDEVFDAVEVNGIYKMPKLIPGWTSNEPLMVCFNKTATEADFNGLTNFTNALYTLQSKFVKGAAAPTLEYIPIYIGEPTINNHATTKKYVDDKFSEDITFTFDDGTTAVIKAGK